MNTSSFNLIFFKQNQVDIDLGTRKQYQLVSTEVVNNYICLELIQRAKNKKKKELIIDIKMDIVQAVVKELPEHILLMMITWLVFLSNPWIQRRHHMQPVGDIPARGGSQQKQ